MSHTAAPLMLGVSGLRGIVGSSLTLDVATRFAGALGSWLVAGSSGKKPRRGAAPTVMVGRDGRAGGEAIYHAAIAGVLASGCDAMLADIAMTPSMGVLTDMMGASAGLIVTASHNPQEWNGLKVLLPGAKSGKGGGGACAPSKAIADEIIARFRGAEAAAGQAGEGGHGWERFGTASTVSYQVVHGMHAQRVAESLGSLVGKAALKRAKFRVVLDSVGGSGGLLSAGFLEHELHAKVEHLGAYSDGRFTHTPEPTRENLTSLCRAVKKAGASVGFAQDPDADRLAIIDEKGAYIGEELTLVLAALALAELGEIGRGSLLAANLSTSRMIDDVAAGVGARVLRTAVGEANVVETMKSRRCVLGGEGNGGVIWPRVTYVRDSLSAMGLILALIAKRKQPLSAIVASLPRYAIEKRKVEIPSKDAANPAIERIAAAYRGERIDRQDGVRVDWVDRRAWLHVRASNTEPIMRLIAEAPTPGEARSILDEAAAIAQRG